MSFKISFLSHSPNLTVFVSPHRLAEKRYVLNWILGERLNISFVLKEEATCSGYRFELPNGRTLFCEDHFFSAFAEDYKAAPLPRPFLFENCTVLYGVPEITSDLGHLRIGADIFASTFFMLTRWEEYVQPQRDEHGRFPAEASTAVREGFLRRPVVDEYTNLLWQFLLDAGWTGQRPETAFHEWYTCDVDHPRLWWSAAGRLRTLAGSLLRRQNLREWRHWLEGPIWSKTDPYDVFEKWMDWAEAQNVTWCFNFLGDRNQHSDCWYPLRHPFTLNLIREMEDRGHTIGFHPSYEAFDHHEVFLHELRSLQQVVRQPIRGGRHHYLRFAAPFTWKKWADAGLSWDSTVGFAELPGFRCGTCHSFPVFDFLSGTTLPLREHPLIAMDITYSLYLGFSKDAALEDLDELRSQVRHHAGELVLLMHNSCGFPIFDNLNNFNFNNIKIY